MLAAGARGRARRQASPAAASRDQDREIACAKTARIAIPASGHARAMSAVASAGCRFSCASVFPSAQGLVAEMARAPLTESWQRVVDADERTARGVDSLNDAQQRDC